MFDVKAGVGRGHIRAIENMNAQGEYLVKIG